MVNVPTLVIHFTGSNLNKQVGLLLTPFNFELPHTAVPVPCSLSLPFPLEQIPLVLRALNARQYPDYPDHERLMRQSDNRTQIIRALRTLGIWEGNATNGAVASDVHVRLGQQLGNALLSDPAMGECLNHLYNAAILQGNGEILLSFDPEAIALATLPWEVAHNGRQPILLTRGVVLSCTRVIDFAHELPPPRVTTKRLRVLTITPRVSEIGQTFEQLARSRMHEAFHSLPVDIETLPQNTMEALYLRLSQEPSIGVLDYYGHGVFTEKGGALLLENAQGGRDPVTASRLAALPNLPSFVALHACQSAQLDIEEPLASVAIALSDAGVRAVLAMQLTIRMMAATHGIAPTLYGTLARGNSVQQAVSAIRQRLYTGESDGSSWYIPVLYLRQQDNKPFVLLKRPPACPPNPFVGDGAFKDTTQFVGRKVDVQRVWDRLSAGGNISIIGPAGSGKSTFLTLIITTLRKQMEIEKLEVIWLPLQRNMKLTEAQLTLARKLGGPKAKATDLLTLLEGRQLILLLDDLGQLDKGERGLEIRLWLRQLSQDRLLATIQLVATSLRALRDTFKEDESPDYSPLHNVLSDRIELGAFTEDEARHFIVSALDRTPFQLQDFEDILLKPMLPRTLREACQVRYEKLCQSKANQ
jgi:hypothetical protein